MYATRSSSRGSGGARGGFITRSGRARCKQRQADEEEVSGMSGSMQWQLLGCEY